MKYDPITGYPIPSRPSNVHCQACGRVFAAGHVPRDGVLVCTDCRNEGQDIDPDLLTLDHL